MPEIDNDLILKILQVLLQHVAYFPPTSNEWFVAVYFDSRSMEMSEASLIDKILLCSVFKIKK
jgi:hypothetical protein